MANGGGPITSPKMLHLSLLAQPRANHVPINDTSPAVQLQSQGQEACDHSQNPSPRQVVQDEIEANVPL